MKFLVVLSIFFSLLFADFELELPANAVSMKLDGGELFVGLDNGELHRYSLAKKELNKVIELPKISNYFDAGVPSKIFGIDRLGSLTALLYESDNGSKNLGIISKDFKSYKLPTDGVKKIFLLDNKQAILLTLSSEIEYYDFSSGSVVFEKKLSTSSMGDADLDRDSGILAVGIEGGLIFYFDTKKREIIKQISAQKDSIYSIGLHKNMLISGSADKKCYFNNRSKELYFEAKFLVYCVGVSQEFGAFTTEDSVKIIDRDGEIFKEIPYSGSSLNALVFSDEYLIGSSYDNKIYFWSIK